MTGTFDLSPLWLSLKTATIATLITFCLGLITARWMLTYTGKLRSLLDGLFTLPLVLPPTVIGFFLLLLFGRYGLLGRLLSQFGITVIFSWTATVIASAIVAFPLMYRTALGAFEQVDLTLLHAARTLGASEWLIFWQILMPLALPGVMAGTVLAFARALGEFGATLMLAGNIPGKTQTIPIAIFFVAEAGNLQQALIWVMIMIVIALAVIAGLNYWSYQQRSMKSLGQGRHKLQSVSLSVSRCLGALQVPFRNHDRSPPVTTNPYLSVDLDKQLGDFNLRVAFDTDQTLGVLGASGSGKSMTLRCIAGLETPDRGHISLNGRILFDCRKGINRPTQKRHVGFLFQNYALFPHMTVTQNIAFGLQHLPKTERDRRVTTQIAAMHLHGLEQRYPSQLSGGQQQRVALARALATEPDLLLLDEPFSALDTHLRSQMERQLSQTLATYPGVTLFVTHNLEEVFRVCQNLLILSNGQVIAHAPKHQIFEHPATVTVAQLTGCKNFSRAELLSSQQVRAIDWNCVLTVADEIPTHLQFIGIRAHQISFVVDSSQSNTFFCWLVQTSETPHRMTLYLKLHQPPVHDHDYHLQAEVFKEKWFELRDRSTPWRISLAPQRLLLMTATAP